MEYAQMKHSFDTHKYIKALVAQGLQEAQAETIVSTIVESKEFDLSRLVTKDQFSDFRNYSTNQFSLLQKEIDLLRKDIEYIKNNVATKEELHNLKIELKKDNELLRQEVKADLASLRAEISYVKFDILKWIIPFMFTNTIAILGIIIAIFFRG